MDKTAQANRILKEIDSSIKYLTGCANGSERLAFGLKMVGALFTAFITILLGWDFASDNPIWPKNIALCLSALATVLATWDGFYNPRSAWIQSQHTVGRLESLQREVSFYIAGTSEEKMTTKELVQFQVRLNGIIDKDSDDWYNMIIKDIKENAKPESPAPAPDKK